MPDVKQPDPFATILAGAKVPARIYVAGDQPDEVKEVDLAVWVRQMPARHLLGTVLYLQDNEVALLSTCCTHVRGQSPLPEGWVDNLTDDSHLALLEKVRALNFSRMAAMVERIRKIQKQLEPLAPPTTSLPNSSTTVPSSSVVPTTSS